MRIICLILSIAFVGCANTHPISEFRANKKLIFAPFAKGFERDRHESRTHNYMIASQGEASTKAGAQMFKNGGNAIDAAAAVSFAISVERPQSTGLGGGGFMLVHFAKKKKTVAVDFREQAPGKATEKMYLNKNGKVIPKLSLDGAKSIGVPGIVAGIVEVHSKYGLLPLSTIIQPAIDMAEDGIRVYPHLANAINHRKDVLRKYPGSRALFFRKDGTPLQEGDLLVQQDLAQTLRVIQKQGRAGFYKGEVAKKIIASQIKHGGLMRQSDLDNYQVKFRVPVWGTFRGLRIASMPPPSSGGIHVIQILNMLESDKIEKYGIYSPQTVHLTASSMQQAFADRATYLGDQDFVSVPVKGLTSKKYAEQLRSQIHNELATPSRSLRAGNPWPYENPYESAETTHFTVMDKEGNTVSSTQTINYYFGSGIVAEGTGVVLNDEMDDFSTKPGAKNIFGAVGSKKNAVAPGKRPLSSMSPTIVFKKDKPILALGTPSGTRIITCVAQTILNYVVHELPLFESVALIRYHHQWSPDEITVDSPGFSSVLTHQLLRRGYSVREKNLGCSINAIAREGNFLHGVADPRGEGLSMGD